MRYLLIASVLLLTTLQFSYASHSVDPAEYAEVEFAKVNGSDRKQEIKELLVLISADKKQKDKAKKDYLIELIKVLDAGGLSPGEQTLVVNRVEAESQGYSQNTKAAILEFLDKIQDQNN